MMLGAQSAVGMITALTEETNLGRSITSSSIHYSSLKLRLRSRKCCKLKPKIINLSCKINNNRGSFNNKPNNREACDDDDHDYFEANVLLSETIRHYRMLVHGFQEQTKWQSSALLVPFSVRVKDPRANISSLGPEFFHRFQSPTIFLKISCDGEFVLPIIVGEYAVEKLIDSLHEDETGDCPNQFQLVRDLLERRGYEVKMVRITERVVNTYFARIYFHKPGEKSILSVDARPSDAINVSRRCKAPIFVNKHIILTDAIRMSRIGNAKSTYDVYLDSAIEGPDLLSEELHLVRNMNLAANEERYSDAAVWRDKLLKLRDKHRSSLF